MASDIWDLVHLSYKTESDSKCYRGIVWYENKLYATVTENHYLDVHGKGTNYANLPNAKTAIKVMEEDGTFIEYFGVIRTTKRCYFGITMKEMGHHDAELFITDFTHHRIYVFSTKTKLILRRYENIRYAYGIIYYRPFDALYVTSNGLKSDRYEPMLYILHSNEGTLITQQGLTTYGYSGIDIFNNEVFLISVPLGRVDVRDLEGVKKEVNGFLLANS